MMMDDQEVGAPEEFLPGYSDYNSFNTDLTSKLVSTIRFANGIPQGQDYRYLSSFTPYKQKMNELSRKLLAVSQSLLDQQTGGKFQITGSADQKEELSRYDAFSDAGDRILENVDILVDAIKGVNNNKMGITTFIERQRFAQRDSRDHTAGNRHTVTAKPQEKFETPFDNSKAPFKPDLKEKCNALKPLSQSLLLDESIPSLPKWSHPYETEIKALQFHPRQLAPCQEMIYWPIEAKTYHFVQTKEQLEELANLLNHIPEFAVDLEAHNFRTYQTIVCLMQISTRMDDFIIDTLALRSHMHLLNPAFTNPNVVKANFGIYVVNMFDTGQASRILEYPKFSLAYLLSFYCNVNADKQFQLADWRVRPLTAEMLKYAREDTHYLLYIYDRMRNELINRSTLESDLLRLVWERSRELCLLTYEKPMMTETSHLGIYNRYNLVYNPPQMRVFQRLFKWRDDIAREEDESVMYILPNQLMFRISEKMPQTSQALLECSSGTLPSGLKNHFDTVLNLVSEALKEPSSPVKSGSTNEASFVTPVVRRTETRLNQNGESPVLSADQLYRTAGWISDGTDMLPKPLNAVEAMLSPINKGNITSPHKKGLANIFTMEEEREGKAAKRSREMAEKIAASIRMETARAKIVYAEPTAVKREEEKAEETEEVDRVPKSMAEIYALSNQIRKKRSINKQAETDKKDGSSDGESEHKRHKPNSKNGKAQLESLQTDVRQANEFMKDIGWIDSNSTIEEVEPVKRTAAPKIENKTTKKGITPFDYNSVTTQQAEKYQRTKKPQGKFQKPQGASAGAKSGNTNWRKNQ
ncbi:hypothetical protein PROFUN_02630 [Planoprotostelium fungivorum]|uniref:HRDC domain-containing protein n=1 Tax=Planoprotostelium fungivorum TaxID=1890364 RepID=A0A2P6NVA8_9EUKA|nr:hypothetical protein PROFUN_02630 [Planoprotostelium fungivorum]